MNKYIILAIFFLPFNLFSQSQNGDEWNLGLTTGVIIPFGILADVTDSFMVLGGFQLNSPKKNILYFSYQQDFSGVSASAESELNELFYLQSRLMLGLSFHLQGDLYLIPLAGPSWLWLKGSIKDTEGHLEAQKKDSFCMSYEVRLPFLLGDFYFLEPYWGVDVASDEENSTYIRAGLSITY
ncbi:DUF2715 domain-containing protein [Spirochaeta cellobiosiphila]|uniref:DUF2715 domain-containing protein n=1 Tax=Spirochaeta cellobiosiphila TaxID=504483 RepID=UPI00041F2952|nr:DUF2715 domain-containing protein [Spirochaeta cellobiosiphila]